jgi:hypothetical protein
LISTLATTTPVTRSVTPTHRAVEAGGAPATTIAITTGDNRTLERATATAMMATSGRSDGAPETTGKGQADTDRIAITIPDLPTEIATIDGLLSGDRARRSNERPEPAVRHPFRIKTGIR